MLKLYASTIVTMMLLRETIAQVWTLQDKEYYAQVSFSTASIENAYDSTGNTISLAPFRIEDLNLQLFGMYGITDQFTVSLRLPYSVQETIYTGTDDISTDSLLSTSITNLSYFGNIEVGALYKIRSMYPIVTTSLFIESYTHDKNYYAGLSSGYDAWSFKPGIAMAGAVKKIWYSTYAGVDLKTSGYSSGFVSNVEVGYKPVEMFFIAANSFLRSSFNNGNHCDCFRIPSGLFFDKQEYVSLSIKPGFNFNGLGLNFGYTLALMAKNSPASSIFTVGFSYKKIHA